MSSSEFLGERRRALEECFFAIKNEQLLAQLKVEAQQDQERENLSKASGVMDAEVLDIMLTLGVTPETVAALSLVPLIEVAWADGSIAAMERDAILSAARQQGLAEGSAGMMLLGHWLEDKPPTDLFQAWTGYVEALAGEVDAAKMQQVRGDILGLVEKVAKSAGSILGLTSGVSKAEQDVINRISKCFG